MFRAEKIDFNKLCVLQYRKEIFVYTKAYPICEAGNIWRKGYEEKTVDIRNVMHADLRNGGFDAADRDKGSDGGREKCIPCCF